MCALWQILQYFHGHVIGTILRIRFTRSPYLLCVMPEASGAPRCRPLFWWQFGRSMLYGW